MTNAVDKRIDIWGDPAARTYAIFGLVAAMVLGLSLLQYAEGIWAVAPTMVAIVGLLFRWQSAPVFVLLGVALSLLISQSAQHPMAVGPVEDSLLAGSVVAVMLAHFRLCSMTIAIFPSDVRRTLKRDRTWSGPPVWLELLMVLTVLPYMVYSYRLGRRRRPASVAAERRGGPLLLDEWPRAVLVVCGSAVAAVGLWVLAGAVAVPEMTVPEQWQLGLLLWLTMAPVALIALVYNRLNSRAMTAAEARLILNDQIWRETRGEQRHIARQLAWDRLKRQHRIRQEQS